MPNAVLPGPKQASRGLELQELYGLGVYSMPHKLTTVKGYIGLTAEPL